MLPGWVMVRADIMCTQRHCRVHIRTTVFYHWPDTALAKSELDVVSRAVERIHTHGGWLQVKVCQQVLLPEGLVLECGA